MIDDDGKPASLSFLESLASPYMWLIIGIVLGGLYLVAEAL